MCVTPILESLWSDAVLSDLCDLPAQRWVCVERVAQLRQQAHATLALIEDWLHQNLD
jgi:hypothetical protein